MTRNEAIEVATRLWGTADGLVKVGRDYEKWVLDRPGQPVHSFDANGHPTCHDECAEREGEAMSGYNEMMNINEKRLLRFTLDASDWPLIINDGEEVFTTIPEPPDALPEMTNEAFKAQQRELQARLALEFAHRLVADLNELERRGGAI